MGEFQVFLSYPRNIVLLTVRIVVAYGFAVPAMVKIHDLSATAKWFESIDIPFAHLAAYLVSSVESVGLVLLVLGLLTRLVSLLLGCVMIGAIFFVHWQHGFSVSNNGFETPLYYLLFLLILVTHGAGKYSLDHLIFKDIAYE
jgi:putative oxidoreductase